MTIVSNLLYSLVVESHMGDTKIKLNYRYLFRVKLPHFEAVKISHSSLNLLVITYCQYVVNVK